MVFVAGNVGIARLSKISSLPRLLVAPSEIGTAGDAGVYLEGGDR
jgi:hypothetical protein